MMFRFFADEKSGSHAYISSRSEIHHIKNVLRMRLGDSAEIVAKNCCYRGELEEINTKARFRLCEIIETLEKKNKLVLCFGMCKGKKVDLIAEKCTELDVDVFQPVYCDRSVERKLNAERFSTLVFSAAKQSKRLSVPVVLEPVSFEDAVSSVKGSGIYFEKNGLNSADLSENTDAYLFVGPESGFSASEINLFKQNGFTAVSLGKNVLRCETAAVAAAVWAGLNLNGS